MCLYMGQMIRQLFDTCRCCGDPIRHGHRPKRLPQQPEAKPMEETLEALTPREPTLLVKKSPGSQSPEPMPSLK